MRLRECGSVSPFLIPNVGFVVRFSGRAEERPRNRRLREREGFSSLRPAPLSSAGLNSSIQREPGERTGSRRYGHSCEHAAADGFSESRQGLGHARSAPSLPAGEGRHACRGGGCGADGGNECDAFNCGPCAGHMLRRGIWGRLRGALLMQGASDRCGGQGVSPCLSACLNTGVLRRRPVLEA